MDEKEIEMVGKLKRIMNECGYNMEDLTLTDVWTGHRRDYVMQLRIIAKKREKEELK